MIRDIGGRIVQPNDPRVLARERVRHAASERTGFCGCGCGKRTTIVKKNKRKLGDVAGYPRRFAIGHNPSIRRSSLARYEGVDNAIAVISLPCGAETRIDAASIDLLNDFACYRSKEGYARVRFGTRRVYLHRLVIQAQPGQLVDHINRDRLDNRLANLRLATAAQNSAHSARRGGLRLGKHPFRGVHCFPSGRWAAIVGGQHLGYFATIVEAARAYDRGARERYGEFAMLNFPNEGVICPECHRTGTAAYSDYLPWCSRECAAGSGKGE